jgi:predicted PhzF superfamily epimerase YddE/YHI9
MTIHFKNIQDLDLMIRKCGEMEMEFSIYNTISQRAPDELVTALGIGTIVNGALNKATNILLLEIESSELLESLSPDFEKLKR